MILSETNLDSGKPCRIDVDKLLTTIFTNTGINISMVNNIIDPLLGHYSYEKYDIKTLNLLYSLFRIDDGASPDTITHEIVMSRMLNPQNFFKIFKPFRYGVPIMSEKMY